MRLRAKIIIITAAVSVAMFLALYGGSQLILMKDYERLEKQEVQKNVERTLNVLSNELQDLSSTTGDWAVWDDTYAFVQGANNEYVQANLEEPEAFANLRVDIVVFINTQGKIIFGSTHLPEDNTVSELPQSLFDLIAADDSLWQYADIDREITGFIALEEVPLLFASRPILTTQHVGPIAGALIMGRYLDTEEIEHVSQTLNLPFNVSRFDSSDVEPDFVAAKSHLSETDQVFIQPLDANFVAGYALIDDTYENPFLILRVVLTRDMHNQGIASVNYFLWAQIATGVVFGTIFGMVIEKSITSRVDRLATEVRSIGKSKSFSERLSWNKTDELSILASAIDSMMQERLNTIGELAATVGHDLRNPLTGISNAAYYLKMKYTPETDSRTKQMLDIIDKDVAYANKIVNDLLDYSRKIHLEVTESNPKSVMDEALALVPIPANIHVINLTADKPKVKIDADKMRRVFVNIIKNSVEAMPEGGKLTMKSKENKDKIEFTITDTGAGIPKETLEKLFTPLFTTKAKGMGFGLSICKRIVEAHGGKISAESAVGEGTTFKILIPVQPVLERGDIS